MVNQDRETEAFRQLSDKGFDATRNDTGYIIVERVGHLEPRMLQVINLNDLERLARVLTPAQSKWDN